MPFTLKLKLLYPKLLVIIFILISCMPLRLFGMDNFFPAIDLMVIYYWSAYRPSLIKNWFVFGIGLLKDALFGAPLGVHAFTNLVLRILVRYNKEYIKSSFIIFWQGFALLAAFVTLIKWLLFSFVYGKWLNIDAAILQLLLSVLLYPLFHSLFNGIYLILPRNMRHA